VAFWIGLCGDGLRSIRRWGKVKAIGCSGHLDRSGVFRSELYYLKFSWLTSGMRSQITHHAIYELGMYGRDFSFLP